MLKVIIAGSRDFNDYELLSKELDILIPPFIEEVVSGDARGADSLGAKWAEEHDFPVKHFPAEWDKYGKSAGIIRNHQMGDYADSLIAFWDGKSRGTKDMIDYMTRQNKHTKVIHYTKTETMKVVIIWNGDEGLLARTMEKLIMENQTFLFTVLCGGTDESNLKSSAGYRWAIRNGAPVEFLVETDVEKLLNKIAQTADYIVCYNDGTNQLVKRLIMKFKSQGKHGTVIT